MESQSALFTISSIVLTFSAALPSLYPIACTFCICSYWIHKWLALRYHRKSPTFNEEIAMKLLSLQRWPVLMHGLVGFFVLSNESIFYRATDSSLHQDKDQVASALAQLGTEKAQSSILKRLSLHHVAYFAVFYLLVLAGHVFQELILKLFSVLCNCRNKVWVGGGHNSESDDLDEQEKELQLKKERYQRNKALRLGLSATRDHKLHSDSDSDAETNNGGYNVSFHSKSRRSHRSSLKSARHQEDFGQYRDDFFEELNVENLVKYYQRNEVDIKESTKAAVDGGNFSNKKTTFVGTRENQYNPKIMREHIKSLKRRKKTLRRKLNVYLINPVLAIGDNLTFEQQLLMLVQKKEMLLEDGGIQSEMQSYDIMDSQIFQAKSIQRI